MASLDFSARDALMKAHLRDSRLKATFNKVLQRILAQIEQVCDTQNSLVYEVPTTVIGEVMPYDVEDMIDYLITALKEDRQFIVIRCPDSNKLYVKWISQEEYETQAQASDSVNDTTAFIPSQGLPSISDESQRQKVQIGYKKRTLVSNANDILNQLGV